MKTRTVSQEKSFPTTAGEDAAAARIRFRGQLIRMKPFEQFNILILGQTGAGKSTLINSIINYLLYDTFQDALQADQLSFAVPGSFSFEHEKIANKTIHVKWGSENPTESFSNQGQSATQSCIIYAVNINGRLFRFVDTPGLGDTRGIDQDHKNVADIMRVLESLNTISSILFVIKNNESRLTASFDFVLTELMMHLHKDTIKNIMFCFTYGRTSFPPFAVGTAAKPLIQLLTEKKLPLKLITDQNAFVIDAEGFLHAAAWQQNHVHMMKDMNTISDSWLISAEKTRLLINVIMALPVHDTGETLGLERNRRLVEGMSMTMVSMTEVMAITKENVNAKIKEITELEKAGKAIDAKQMQYEVVSIVDEKLDYPRTVCKGDGCAVMKADPNITGMATLVFEKSCHEPCSINAPEARFGVRELGECWCFADEGSDCNECRHPFTSHCHISYRQVIKRETKTNEYVKREKEENDMRTTRAEMWKAKFKEDEDQIVSEEKQVRETMAKFSIYLGENSVTAYNDGVVEHLKYLMDNAKAKGHTDQRDKYAAQIAAHKALIAEREKEIAANQDKALTDRDIQKLLGELKELPMYGASFRALLNRKDAQVPYQSAIPVKISKSGSKETQ
ncbi:hypothetical protein NUW58_g1542 [Xylaria curta]|uniref:Uncharacterized protein n=1 Tax=Xylaria curta TaxID=42375 RepID=A0ACC1PN09_9PEZI|nr:hypothetical protein NUW58_g1542 [Xylaria curta]